jgi:uncharacterized protein with GYD domain
MPKYLVEFKYVGEGITGLLKEGGTSRCAAVKKLYTSLGGTIEAIYFAFGDHDGYIIGDLPDHASAAALALTVSSSGRATVRQRCC